VCNPSYCTHARTQLWASQVRARLLEVSGPDTKLEWTHNYCDGTTSFTVMYLNGTISCAPCPKGGDCSARGKW
jgi:hypothetical protein